MIHYETQAAPESTDIAKFHRGDEVFLAQGPYQGTLGTFLNIKADDANWADILEQNSEIRSHPLGWLERYQPAANSSPEAIRASAYDRWVARGRPIGSPEVDWLHAEEDGKKEGAKAAV